MDEGYLRNLQIVPIPPIGQCARMVDSLLLLITAAFLLAGFIKGVLGPRLPTVSFGLLAVTFPPSRPLAIPVVPAAINKACVTFLASRRPALARRLWTLFVRHSGGL